uniref:ERVV2 protein n=1 Tax=Podarcis muralis TaxID=64176 RepID=A0A670IPT2_PODMU
MWILPTRARDPIYNLNRIIRLQAVVELVTNATAQSLRLIAQQLDESRATILQLKMGMDYVLAKQGSLCGVLNLTGNACCFNISDNGEAIRVLATKMESQKAKSTWKTNRLEKGGKCEEGKRLFSYFILRL